MNFFDSLKKKIQEENSQSTKETIISSLNTTNQTDYQNTPVSPPNPPPAWSGPPPTTARPGIADLPGMGTPAEPNPEPGPQPPQTNSWSPTPPIPIRSPASQFTSIPDERNGTVTTTQYPSSPQLQTEIPVIRSETTRTATTPPYSNSNQQPSVTDLFQQPATSADNTDKEAQILLDSLKRIERQNEEIIALLRNKNPTQY